MVNKALGQHWLRNREILDEIAGLARGDFDEELDWWMIGEEQGSAEERQALISTPVCLEIGPGLGTLTSALLRRFDRVIAVEYDADLAQKLPGSFPGKDLTVINEDFLQFDLLEVPAPYVVAGNIPYYITSPIIEKLLTAKNRPLRVVLLMQKEVAERIVSERESLLSLRCKNRARVALGPVVSREEFEPAPKVDSAVVVFMLHGPIVGEEVMELAERGFAQPRKKVVHNLAGAIVKRTDGSVAESLSKDKLKTIFEENGLNPDARPRELHLADWQKIYDLISGVGR